MATPNYFIVKNGLAVGNTSYTKDVINNAGQFIGDPTGVIQNSYNQANTANNLAQSAYNQANTANVLAQAAFDYANTITGGLTYTASNVAPVGATLGDQWYYVAKDILYEWATDGNTSFWLDIQSPSVGITSELSVNAIDYYARTTANATQNGIVVIQGVNNTQNTNITSVGLFAQSAYNTANIGNNFINTGGTVNGDITVTGNVTPTTDNVYYLGSASNRFHSLYVGPGSVHIDDIVLSKDNNNLKISGVQDLVVVGSQLPSTQGISNTANAAFDKANAANDLAQSAFNSANNVFPQIQPAYNHANAAFDQANATNSYAVSAYGQANTNAGDITIIQGVNVTQNTNITASDNLARGAFTQANAANDLAQSAYGQANTNAGNITIIQGVDLTQNTNITAADNLARGAFTQANAATDSAQAAYNQANTNATNITVLQGVDLTQNTLITAADNLARGAFDQANATNNYAVSAYGQANATNSYAISAYNQANITNSYTASAYGQANAATNSAQAAYNAANVGYNLVNTGGTVTGNLTVTKDLAVTGNLFILGNTTSINTSSFNVQDSMIILGIGNYSTDLVDIGFAGHYNAGTNAHAGIIRDASEKEFYVFDNYTPELSSNNNIDINDPSFRKANINAGQFKGNLIATTAVVNGYNIFDYSSAAFNTANTATTNVTLIQGVNTTQNTSITAADNLARGAFGQANATNSYATSGYAQANAATNSAQAAYNQANATNSYAQSAYAAGNTNAVNITATNNFAVGAYNTANTAATNIAVMQGVNTTQNTSITAADNLARGSFTQANAATNSAQAAYNTANTATSNITIIQGVDLTQNTNITAADNLARGAFGQANATNSYAQSAYAVGNTNAVNITATNNFAAGAYNKANNALANTTGTFSGSLSVTGQFTSLNSVGDEGGQIDLSKAATNTTLTTGVSIDVFKNNLRIFETGGTNRGVYLDIANNASAGVGTSLVGDNTTQTLTNKTLRSYTEAVNTIGTISSTTYTIDTSTANIFDLTLGTNVTITFSNAPAAGFSRPITMIVRQPAASPGKTITVTGAKYTEGVAPVLSTGANQIDVLTYWSVDGGTSYFGTFAMANVA